MSHRAFAKRRQIAAVLAGLTLASAVVGAPSALAQTRVAVAVLSSTWQPRRDGETVQPRVQGVRMADADCSAAAAEAAAQTGGQVLSVSSRNDGDRTVCVVTVLVPGEDGQRPRKRTLTLPQ